MTPSATSRLSWLTRDVIKNLVKPLQLATIEGMDAVDSYFLRNYMPTLVIIGIDCLAIRVKFILQPSLPGVQTFSCDVFNCILIHIFFQFVQFLFSHSFINFESYHYLPLQTLLLLILASA